MSVNTLDEKRKTAQNDRSEILDARVIANYGDPGLDEDYQFDILSRYVIVMIESSYRVLTADKWFKMLAVVQRPKHLWISSSGGIVSPASQRREDANGNINIGLASAPSTKGISSLNKAYYLGEQIKIRRLATPYTFDTFPSFFQSAHASIGANTTYGDWHTEGGTSQYMANNPALASYLRAKTISSVVDYRYRFQLFKAQYEAFMLSIVDGSISPTIETIFGGGWNGASPVYSANGGYVFNGTNVLSLNACEYEDMNIGYKARLGTNECIPLVVTTPNSFPTPKTRQIGTINYNPSYSPIAR